MELFASAPDILTLSAAAKLLHVSTDVLKTAVEQAKLPCISIGNAIRIAKPDLCDYLERARKPCYTEGAKHLENSTGDFTPTQEGEPEMAKKFNQYVTVGGKKHWIAADSAQEFADKVAELAGTAVTPGKHRFDDYAWNWFHTYSEPNIETVTATTYRRQIKRHLAPAFEGLAIEDITTDDVQRLFNGMQGAKETKNKAKIVLNQILDSAVEERLITFNPLKSRRLKITGNASKETQPYTVEQMRFLVDHLGAVQESTDRMYLALQALHPLRLEEVLGLKWADVDLDGMELHIRRAVTHPNRNQPEVKETKTEASTRTVGLAKIVAQYLAPGAPEEFVIGGAKPYTYTQVRRMCGRIKADTGFEDNITPIRFRTTVLTDMYDQTSDIKQVQAAAGHTTSAMTLKYYVKGRASASAATAAIDRLYGSQR